MKVLLLFIFSTFCTVIFAQNGYTLPDSSITFDKDVTFGTVHGYLEIISDTSDTLPMVWVARKKFDFPNEWVVNFDDQSNYHPVINSYDRDTFDLFPAGSFVRKLIIGLAHNGVADTSSIYFTLNPRESPNDSTVIEYQFRIAKEKADDIDTTDTTTGVDNQLRSEFEINLINTGQWTLTTSSIADEIKVYGILGNLLASAGQSNTLALSEEMTESIIIVAIRENGKVHSQKFTLSR